VPGRGRNLRRKRLHSRIGRVARDRAECAPEQGGGRRSNQRRRLGSRWRRSAGDGEWRIAPQTAGCAQAGRDFNALPGGRGTRPSAKRNFRRGWLRRKRPEFRFCGLQRPARPRPASHLGRYAVTARGRLRSASKRGEIGCRARHLPRRRNYVRSPQGRGLAARAFRKCLRKPRPGRDHRPALRRGGSVRPATFTHQRQQPAENHLLRFVLKQSPMRFRTKPVSD
jgi:hypothetical protein